MFCLFISHFLWFFCCFVTYDLFYLDWAGSGLLRLKIEFKPTKLLFFLVQSSFCFDLWTFEKKKKNSTPTLPWQSKTPHCSLHALMRFTYLNVWVLLVCVCGNDLNIKSTCWLLRKFNKRTHTHWEKLQQK